MSVEDWASEEARGFVPNLVGQFGFKSGIVHAFSALLSDEAVEAVIISTRGMGPDTLDRAPAEDWEIADARAALLTAIAAVTEGDTE